MSEERVNAWEVQDHPHACLDGWVYLTYLDDEDEEQIEALPCRRCAEEGAL